MADREKVIRALENCTDEIKCRDCPWETCEDFCLSVNVPLDLAKAALSLLKAQEPIEPIKHLSTGQICGSCKKVLLRKYKYCPSCGKEVKWE